MEPARASSRSQPWAKLRSSTVSPLVKVLLAKSSGRRSTSILQLRPTFKLSGWPVTDDQSAIRIFSMYRHRWGKAAPRRKPLK